jgi:hypothetical protein
MSATAVEEASSAGWQTWLAGQSAARQWRHGHPQLRIVSRGVHPAIPDACRCARQWVPAAARGEALGLHSTAVTLGVTAEAQRRERAAAAPM